MYSSEENSGTGTLTNRGGFQKKLHPKSDFLPQIAPITSSHFLTFLSGNLKITLDYRAKKSNKSKKLSALYAQFEEMLSFWAFITPNCACNGTFSNGLHV